jgi:hypothetical protein
MNKGRLLLERLTEGERSSWLLLASAMVLAFVVRTEQARRLATPQLLCDEFIYAELAKSFADEGRLLFRGEPLHLSLLYPILLAPAWLAERMETTYAVAKTINAALMTASAIPLYLLARRVVPPGWALLAPLLTLLLPMTLLSGLLMTESAFMPTFLLAVYAIVLVLERATLAHQTFALTAIALATAVRFQGIVLAAVLATALLLLVIFELRAVRPRHRVRFALDRLRPYWPTAALLLGAVVLYVALDTVRGGGLGAYEEVTKADYSLSEAWRSTRLHLADLALTSGLAPLSALILLSSRAFAGDGGTPSERAFAAVAIATVAWLLIQVGLFTSRFTSGGIAERYLFYAMPLLFLALAVWLARGLPRPRIATAFAAVAPGAVVVLEPLTSSLSPALLPSSLGLFAFYRLSTGLGDGVDDLIWLIRLGAIAAAVAFALLWRPVARIALPLGLAAFFLISTHPVAGQLRQQAAATSQDPALNPNPQWIHDTVGEAGVGYLLTAVSDDVFEKSRTMLGVNFWNPSVRSVIHLGRREVCRLPARSGRIDAATGHIIAGDSDVLPRYLVAPVGLDLAGSAIARQGPLVLYRAVRPVSLLQSVEGVHSDLWMGTDATYTRYYGPGPGEAIVELSREFYTAEAAPSAVRITAGPLVADTRGVPRVGQLQIRRRWTLHNGDRKVFVIPARKVPFRVSVHIEPTFSAAGFGAGDERQISARVRFGFRSTGSQDDD